MQELGFNYRITDIQCSLGLSQLKKIDWFLEKRREIAEIYYKNFKDIEEIKLLKPDSSSKPSWHLFPVQIDFKEIGKTRKEVFDIYLKNSVEVQVHYVPLHYQPYYSKECTKSFPAAEKFYETCLSLPIYVSLSKQEQEKIIKITLNQVIN